MIADPLARGAGGGPQIVDDLAVAVEVAVGKVEPGDVHPGPYHPLHDLPRFGGRADGADDLGLVVGQIHIYEDHPFWMRVNPETCYHK